MDGHENNPLSLHVPPSYATCGIEEEDNRWHPGESHLTSLSCLVDYQAYMYMVGLPGVTNSQKYYEIGKKTRKW